MRIGLVQPEVAVADFSSNLRTVVQEARACVDAGAELLLAPAQALDGAFPGGLSTRSSFMLHARAALQALADELSVPMLLASFAGEPDERRELPSAYLLRGGNVRRVKRTVRLFGKRIAICMGEQSTPILGSADVCVHMPMKSWYAEQAHDDAQHVARQAQHGMAVVAVQAVAWADGLMLGGGSLAASGGTVRCLLPSFQRGHAVWDTENSGVQEGPTLRTPQILWKAVCFAVRQAVQQGGYRGVAIAEASPRAQLLRSAACSALGVRGMHTLRCVEGRSVRMSCAELQDRAWEHELLLLSGASREDILCGGSDLMDAGELAPFGDLYESEIAQLGACVGLGSRQLVHPTQRELALRALVDENRSPAEISLRHGMDEGMLRALMRSMARTAALSHTFAQPVVVRTRRCVPTLPRFHRLME